MSDEVWTTKTGEKFPVKDMTDAHVSNVVGYLRRRVEELCAADNYAWVAFAGCRGDIASYHAEQETVSVADKRSTTQRWLETFRVELRRRGLMEPPA